MSTAQNASRPDAPATSAPSGPAGLPVWSRPFALDARGLAVLRIGIGLMCLIDWAVRLSDLGAFYLDDSAVPRSAVLAHMAREHHLSLYMATGGLPGTLLLFAVHGAAALAFTLGWRTRVANAVLWVMVFSIHSRAPVVTQSADAVLRLVLFWCLFLPLGARAALDARRAAAPPPLTVVSIGTLGLVVQLASIYLFTGWMKTGAPWQDGTAVYYALQLDHFARQPMAGWLLEQPALMALLTRATLVLEVLGPWLLLIPLASVRLVVCLAFAGFHVGLAATMHLGIFPWICVIMWMALMPSGVWDRLWARSPEARPGEAGERSSGLPRWASAAAIAALALMINWNLSSLYGKSAAVPEPVRWIGHVLRLDQNWTMFAPQPFRDDGWLLIPGQTLGGEPLDLWTGEAPVMASPEEIASWSVRRYSTKPEEGPIYDLSRRKPHHVSAQFPNQRWRKYIRNLYRARYAKMRLYYGQWLCRRHNVGRTGDARLGFFRLVFMREDSPPPGKATLPVRPIQLWRHRCFDDVPWPDERAAR